MRIHQMTISMVADNGLQPVRMEHISPRAIAKGPRIRIGWFFIRLGARIIYPKGWICM